MGFGGAESTAQASAGGTRGDALRAESHAEITEGRAQCSLSGPGGRAPADDRAQAGADAAPGQAPARPQAEYTY
jgi:hypothetical protein